MSSPKEWDTTYRQGGQAIQWPWSDVVGFVTRHGRPGPGYRVLELGCGSGANIPFFQAARCDYYSVEGSATAVARVQAAHPELRNHIVMADFTSSLPVPGEFDLILDRAALTHNSALDIRRALSLSHRKLKPEGRFIGVDWFSTLHTDYSLGKPGADVNTRTGYQTGIFAGLGEVHFSDERHILELFQEFEMLVLEHKTLETRIPIDGRKIATWNFVARKRT
jgi:SAM-dependent methyltransferase